MTEHDDRGDAGPSSTEETDGPRSLPSAGPPAGKHKHMPFWQELFLLLGLALVLAVGIKALVMQAFYIPSGSMNDTLVFNDRILVQKISYWGEADPERGDVVVFADPGGWLSGEEVPRPRNVAVQGLEWVGLFPTGGHLVKRVIAVGGDTVQCCDRKGRVRVNGTPLAEGSYLAPGEEPSLVTFKQVVPEGYLWVMGDNRSQSADSRAHLGDPGGGFVPVEDVVGKVFAVVWPIDNSKLLRRPGAYEAVGR